VGIVVVELGHLVELFVGLDNTDDETRGELDEVVGKSLNALPLRIPIVPDDSGMDDGIVVGGSPPFPSPSVLTSCIDVIKVAVLFRGFDETVGIAGLPPDTPVSATLDKIADKRTGGAATSPAQVGLQLPVEVTSLGSDGGAGLASGGTY
jgi:hypothetical protein